MKDAVTEDHLNEEVKNKTEKISKMQKIRRED